VVVSVLEGYRILDHEADIGFEVYGQGEEELFQNATLALFSQIMDLETVRTVTERQITITGNGETLILFLNELLYLWDVDKFIPRVITIKKEHGTLMATIRGEILDEQRHIVLTQVKAVTYHKFSITENQGKLKAIFIVDM
jgi:SHS2 domain-containing protein